MLSPELSKTLTQPSINEFHRFQLECEAKHMTPVEMYLFLSQKYEELVLAEKSAVKEIAAKIKKDRKDQKDAAKRASAAEAHTKAAEKSILHSGSSTVIANNVIAPNKSNVEVKNIERNNGPNEKNFSPRVSLRRKSADHVEPPSGQGQTSRPTSLRVPPSSADATIGGLHSSKPPKDKELHQSTIILNNGQIVQVASSAEMEENGIAEELALELAAMATEEEFQYRDSDDEDDKANSSNFTHDPYVESVVGKVFKIKDAASNKSTPQLKALVNKLIPSSINTAGGSPVASLCPSPQSKIGRGINNNVAVSHVSGDKADLHGVGDTVTDFVIGQTIIHHDLTTGQYTCAVCQLNFDNRVDLDVHLEHSPLHAINLKIRQEIYQGTIAEAERLGKLAKMAISKMMSNNNNGGQSGDKSSNHPMNHHEELQHRWKRAINKVISNRLKQHYMPIIEELFDTPTGVKMLYAGEKIFYQTKSHLDIHIYLHIAMDIVEIVIHTLPNRKQRVKSKQRVAQEIREHDAHVHESITGTDNVLEEHTSDYLKPFIHPLTRLYLDFTILVPMVLGIDRQESGLHLDSHATVLQAQIKHQIESNQYVSGITSRFAAIHSNSKDIAEAKKMSITIEQAIVSFILNRLRVSLTENSKIEKDPSKKLLVSFDLSQYAGHPMLETSKLKEGFKPVPLTEERIRKHYDRKLVEEVSHEVHPDHGHSAGDIQKSLVTIDEVNPNTNITNAST